jgi:hypothetical protein
MDVIKSEVYSWAAETSQEHVAIEICKAWFLSGERSECIKLYPMDDGCGQADWQAINNNRQKLFRWFDGQSARAVARTRLLRNAILTALPTERRARVSGDKTTYLLIILTKEVSRIITAALMQERDMSQQIKSLRKVLDSLESSISGVDKTRARVQRGLKHVNSHRNYFSFLMVLEKKIAGIPTRSVFAMRCPHVFARLRNAGMCSYE